MNTCFNFTSDFIVFRVWYSQPKILPRSVCRGVVGNSCRNDKGKFLTLGSIYKFNILFSDSRANTGPISYVNCKFDEVFGFWKIGTKHPGFKVRCVIFSQNTSDVYSLPIGMWDPYIRTGVLIHIAPALVFKELDRLIIPLETEKKVRKAVFGGNAFDYGSTIHEVFGGYSSHPFRNSVPFRAGLTCFCEFEICFPVKLGKPRIFLDIFACKLSFIPGIINLLGHFA